jgi:hypothetical protein
MNDDQRAEIQDVLDDLRAEEADQHAERGHASNRVLRAVARLEQLLESSDSAPPGIGQRRS